MPESLEVDALYLTLLLLDVDLDIPILILTDPILVEVEVLEGLEDLQVGLVLVLMEGPQPLLVLECLLLTVAPEFDERETDQVVAVLGLADAVQVSLASLSGGVCFEGEEGLLLLSFLE